MDQDPVKILKALADPIRLSIVRRLRGKPELCACNLLEDFEITQPTLSFHMKKLTECGLVQARKDGIWIKYTLNQRLLDQLHIALSSPEPEISVTDCSCQKP